jgi:TRAP-type mannitol/chloroaromatic compound transport system permease small subunit
MQDLLRLSLSIDRLSRGIARVVAWMTLAMVLVGAYNAVARYVERDLGLSLSSNAYLELQWYLFSLVFLLGAPYTLRAGGHVRVDVLFGGHSQRTKAWIDLAGTLLFLLPFCCMATWFSWEYAAISWRESEVSSDPGGLLRYPLKAVIPLAFILVGAQGISEAIKRLGILRGLSAEEVGLDEPPIMGTER